MGLTKLPFLKFMSKKDISKEVEDWGKTNKQEKIEPPTDPFDNPIFAYCVDIITLGCSSIEYIMTDLNDVELEKPNEKAMQILQRPNKFYNGKRLVSNMVSNYLSDGAGYALIVEGAPQELFFIPHKQVKFQLGNNLLNPIESIDVNGQKKDWEQLIVLNALNPNDNKFGLEKGRSKVEALKGTLDTHNIIRMKNAEVISKVEKKKAIALNNEVKGETEARAKARQIKEQLNDHGDGGIAVLFGDYSSLDLGEVLEGDYLELYKTMGFEICQRLGVPVDLVFGQAKYENMRESIKGLFSNTILPPMEDLVEELNIKLFEPHYRVRIQINYSKIEALQKSVLEYIRATSSTNTNIKNFVSVNEYRENFLDLPTREGKEYDEVDVDTSKDESTKGLEVKKNEVIKSTKCLEEVADNETYRLENKYSAYFKGLSERLKQQFNNISKSDDEDEEDIDFDVEDIFDIDAEVELIRQSTKEEYVSLYDMGWELLEEHIQDIADEVKEDFLRQIGNSIMSISETTRDTIRQIIFDNMETGSARQAKGQIVQTVLDMSVGRAGNIARTETFGALERGQYDSASTLGMKYKVWYASADERTRPAHQRLHKKKILIYEKFNLNGNYGAMPRDSGFAVGDIVNCRCTLGYTNNPD